MKLSDIIKQLKSCGYQCEAGPLENNTAFIELEKISQPEERNFAELENLIGAFKERWSDYLPVDALNELNEFTNSLPSGETNKTDGEKCSKCGVPEGIKVGVYCLECGRIVG